jgi:glycosyltransferase involved in cell wall biosynthesis
MKAQKKRVLVVSAVQPFPGDSGQQVRVRNTLRALGDFFVIDFLTTVDRSAVGGVEEELRALVDHPIVLASRTSGNLAMRGATKVAGEVYCWMTGLKPSNFRLGVIEFSKRRMETHCSPDDYDLVLFEYFHAVGSVPFFREGGVPCVLDMHDVLWRSWERQLHHTRNPVRRLFRHRLVRKYKKREVTSWGSFDAVIAISAGEAEYVKREWPDIPVLTSPMGIETGEWQRAIEPARPPRVGYYGGMSNPYNQRDAMRCYRRIMPVVWERYPDAELWIVGGGAPTQFHELAKVDPRLHVTGFVANIQDILSTLSTVLCPFDGTFGFRSRLIEVMALGVPVVASPEAVYGMGLEEGRGVVLVGDDAEFAHAVCRFLCEPEFMQDQSHHARRQVELEFSFEATYGQLARDLYKLADPRRSSSVSGSSA